MMNKTKKLNNVNMTTKKRKNPKLANKNWYYFILHNKKCLLLAAKSQTVYCHLVYLIANVNFSVPEQ